MRYGPPSSWHNPSSDAIGRRMVSVSNRRNILVVDDDEINRMVVRVLMERRNYRVVEAASGPEAAWNRAMLQSVVAAISDPANAGKEIVLAGFADSAAGSERAIAASASAAADMGTVLTTVAGSFLAENNITLTSYGFGNVSPATCIDGQVAGGDYTRVEVWLR